MDRQFFLLGIHPLPEGSCTGTDTCDIYGTRHTKRICLRYNWLCFFKLKKIQHIGERLIHFYMQLQEIYLVFILGTLILSFFAASFLNLEKFSSDNWSGFT